MIRKILLVVTVLMVIAIAAVNVQKNSKTNSTCDVILSNIEALADPEGITKQNRKDFVDWENNCLIMCFDPATYSCWYEYNYPQC